MQHEEFKEITDRANSEMEEYVYSTPPDAWTPEQFSRVFDAFSLAVRDRYALMRYVSRQRCVSTAEASLAGVRDYVNERVRVKKTKRPTDRACIFLLDSLDAAHGVIHDLMNEEGGAEALRIAGSNEAFETVFRLILDWKSELAPVAVYGGDKHKQPVAEIRQDAAAEIVEYLAGHKPILGGPLTPPAAARSEAAELRARVEVLQRTVSQQQAKIEKLRRNER